MKNKRQGIHLLILIVSLLFLLLSFACKDDNSTGSIGNPPNTPSNPSPDSNASDISLLPTISWDCNDPDGDPLIFDIYFDTSSTPGLLTSGWPNKSYQLTDSLERNRVYYWRVVAKDINDNSTDGPTWVFSSLTNQNPDEPYNLIPESGATDVPITTSLSWQCSDPDGDSIYYEIYFDTLNPPSLLESSWADTSYSFAEQLDNDTHYYWNIIAKDISGGQSESGVQSFTTIRSTGIYEVASIPAAENALAVFQIRDELYVAEAGYGFRIYDITSRSTPFFLGEHQFFGIYAEDIVVEGNFAYVTDANGYGLLIVDIGNPEIPVTAAYLNLPATPHTLALNSTRAYVACDTSGMAVIDVFDVYTPTLDTTLDLGNTIVESIDIAGNYALLGCLGLGLYIIDISDPLQPAEIYNYDTPGFTEQVHAEQAGGSTIVHIADGGGDYSRVDITNPTNPTLITSASVPGSGYDVVKAGDYIYIASYTNGIHILDNSVPPDIIASYLTFGQARDVYVSGGYIYLADGTAGVKILEFVE